MKPGRYDAIVLGKEVTENQKGNPQAVVQVEIDFDGEKRKMNYYGQFAGEAAKHTIKALVACGLRGNSPMDAVTPGTEISVVVDEDQDKDGNPRLKISWINKPLDMGTPINESKGRATLSKFESSIAAMRSQSSELAPLNNEVPGHLTDIPFPEDNEEIPF